MENIKTLQALLDDVKGNQFLGNAKKMSGYLKSMSLLADALARKNWQQFEIEVIDEIRSEKGGVAVSDALNVKCKLAQRELELADLEVQLVDFQVGVSCSAYCTKESAAAALRKIADEIEAKDTELFPKPWTEDDVIAYAKSIGATYSNEHSDLDALLNRLTSKSKKPKFPAKTKISKVVVAK
jgi:hypothetical protein